ncbi:MAG: TonB-dependent receptor [Alphaproteobacteria bacterium]|nr:TonB-dependent receptor [Alphaproteobacteria bacterium]
MSTKWRLGLLAGTALGASVACLSAASADDKIEKVVVTAQKRSEDVQKVPISMKALTGNQLDERGVDGFSALQTQVPSLTFGGQVTGGENAITLRGVGSENVTGGGDPGVAYHADGVYLGRTVGMDETFFDVERIEVLRGPQGTLYGRNSTGGAINVITRKPELGAFSGAANVTFGDYGRLTTRAMVNLPVGDSVAIRIAGVVNQRDGYQDILSPPSVCGDCEGDAADNFNLRGHLYFKLSDAADLLITAGHYENNESVGVRLREPFPANLSGFLGSDRFVGASPNPTDLREVHKDFKDAMDMNTSNVSATLNWDIADGVALTSITAYQKLFWDQSTDGDGSDLPLAYTPYWINDSHQVSQELRLASTGEGANKWLLGVFLYQEDVNQSFQFIDTGYNVFGPAEIPGMLFTFTNGGDIKTTSYAVFGQDDYRFEDGLFGLPTTLTAGLRYTHDEKKGNDFQDFIFFGACALVVPSATTHCAAKTFDDTWNTLTGRAGLQIETSEDSMIYGTVSRGYRSGGVLVGNFPGSYNPEYIWNYELGLKSLFWDDRMQFNVAAFWNTYSDMQVFIQDIAGSRIENAAESTIKGIEIDSVAKLSEDFTVNFGFAWLDATYDSYTTVDSRAGSSGLPEDLTGNRLNRTPEFTAVLGAQYDIPTSAGVFSARADFLWVDEVFFRAQNLIADRQEAYTKTDLRLIWSAPGGDFKAEAFVQNLEDEDVINNIVIPAQTLGGPTSQITLNPPRTFGVRLSSYFGS